MKIVLEAILIVAMDSLSSAYRGSICIEDGIIREIYRNILLPPYWLKAKRIDCRECIAFPGFINSHKHSGYLPWRFGGESNMEEAKKAANVDELSCLIRRSLKEMIKAGVTFGSGFDWYGKGQIVSSRKSLGLVDILHQYNEVGIGGFIRVRLPEYKEGEEKGKFAGELKIKESIDHLKEAVNHSFTYRNKGRPFFLFVHPPVETDPRYSQPILESYRKVLSHFYSEKRVWVHAHCGETAKASQRAFGLASQLGISHKTSVGILDHFGLLFERTVLAHCIHISNADLDLIKKNNARVLSVPKFKDGKVARIGTMLDMEIPTGLCSDAYSADMVKHMEHTYLLQRYYENSVTDRKLKGEECIRLATDYAASVLDLNMQGSIIRGNWANIVVFDLSSELFEPFWDKEFWRLGGDSSKKCWCNWMEPIEKLIETSSLSTRDIRMTIAGGNIVYQKAD